MEFMSEELNLNCYTLENNDKDDNSEDVVLKLYG